MSLRLLMMGTGTFALPTFRALCDCQHQLVGLLTQPDRAGRGHHRHRNLMKQCALEHDIPVYQPSDVNTPDVLDQLRSLDADLYVVAAYGQILSRSLIEIPRLGVINLHASLLPKYRGAAPIQYAILKGETETGVTIFQIQPELDAGPVLAMERTPIEAKETSGDLERRLADLAAPLCLRVIDALASDTIQAVPQDKSLATRAPRLKKSDGAIDWHQSAVEIERHIRAMQPWPKSSTLLRRKDQPTLRLCLLDAEPVESSVEAEPGDIVLCDRKRLVVQTGRGALDIRQLQPEGKRAMSTCEFLCGHCPQPGDRFE